MRVRSLVHDIEGRTNMAVKLRLRREGAKKAPHYRIVVADARSPRDGRFLEIIGEYHPLDQPSTIKIDGERALYWLRNGAQPTDQVKQLLRIEGVWEEFKPGDKPKRDRSAQGEKVKLSKKAKARAAEEAEAAAAPAEEPAADEPAEGADEAAEGGEEESS
jgi:small subunit ribosomal protein S16